MLSPAIITLPWRADAAERYFAPLSAMPWAMLLHSGFADHPYSRFDIIVAEPRATLVTRGEQTWVNDGEGEFVSQDDPLQLLQQQLDRCQLTAQADENLPFLGGALGLFGYDLGRRFERLPAQAQADIALPEMAVGIYDWALIVDHQRQQVSLLSYDDPQQRLQWLESQTRQPAESFSLTSSWQSNMSRQQYGEKFRQVQAYLRSGDCYQVNLAQRFQARYRGDEWQAFCKLNAVNRAPFSAFIRLAEGAILSLSPERFIQLYQGDIQTRPIKGTLPRLDSPQEDARQAVTLAHSPKDRAENLMIVDLMRNDIGRVAVPGSVRVPELFVVEPFPAVHHLVSTITARLPATLDASDLLRAAFPGGSITGAPKVRAMEIIDELEPQRRNAWCGSIGYLSLCGNMDTSITIRTITAWRGQLYCSAGGGIVADSEEAAEYQETFDKVNRILHQLES
ncbi:TPA: aminodeoxychorismate synthase component 1 [Klebsiella aerogenes]|uniref:aminodeoxychorismate synthase component 1 n=1 Tax=Klebsiella sp. 141161 TaxID=3020037 RepID=UPI000DDEA2E1|nr:aminodeoxychorismate synthase component 1 [Klebsiella aerogenes]HBW5536451.1 aminodeoxychorismate synthase component 1 [Klebsiella aerogenes]HCS4221254.1 aminodeoxychorismate synthase component 1 [Klebsiella aerogenes]